MHKLNDTANITHHTNHAKATVLLYLQKQTLNIYYRPHSEGMVHPGGGGDPHPLTGVGGTPILSDWRGRTPILPNVGYTHPSQQGVVPHPS